MRILLTGGYGCIGSWIIKQVVEAGDSIWVYDLKEDVRRLDSLIDEELRKERVRFIAGDIADAGGFRAAVEAVGATHLLHLAGLQVPSCRSDPMLGARVNVLGTLAVFEAAATLRDQVERVVYASSAAVHGPGSAETALPDDIRLSPETHYGAFKVCNELNARVYWLEKGIPSVGLRPWTVYGVGRDFGVTSEPTKAIKAVAAGRSFRIGYGGFQDLQYVADVAEIFLRCLNASEHQGAEALNVRGDVVSIETFIAALRAVAPEAERLVTHGDLQLAIAPNLDDSRLQRLFGPLPRTPLETGIRETFHRFRELRDRGKLDLSDLG